MFIRSRGRDESCRRASGSQELVPWPFTAVRGEKRRWWGWRCVADLQGFPGGSVGKGSTYNAGDTGSIPGSGRSPGGGHGNPLQYSCLENPMDRGAWQATFHRVAKSRTWLKELHTHTHTHTHGRFGRENRLVFVSDGFHFSQWNRRGRGHQLSMGGRAVGDGRSRYETVVSRNENDSLPEQPGQAESPLESRDWILSKMNLLSWVILIIDIQPSGAWIQRTLPVGRAQGLGGGGREFAQCCPQYFLRGWRYSISCVVNKGNHRLHVDDEWLKCG